MCSDSERIDFVFLLIQRNDCLFVDIIANDYQKFSEPIKLIGITDFLETIMCHNWLIGEITTVDSNTERSVAQFI